MSWMLDVMKLLMLFAFARGREGQARGGSRFTVRGSRFTVRGSRFAVRTSESVPELAHKD